MDDSVIMCDEVIKETVSTNLLPFHDTNNELKPKHLLPLHDANTELKQNQVLH